MRCATEIFPCPGTIQFVVCLNRTNPIFSTQQDLGSISGYDEADPNFLCCPVSSVLFSRNFVAFFQTMELLQFSALFNLNCRRCSRDGFDGLCFGAPLARDSRCTFAGYPRIHNFGILMLVDIFSFERSSTTIQAVCVVLRNHSFVIMWPLNCCTWLSCSVTLNLYFCSIAGVFPNCLYSVAQHHGIS